MALKEPIFVTNLRRLRRAKGWSARRLDIEADVSIPTVSRLESKSTNPSFKTMCKIAKALDVTLDEFLKQTQNK